MEDTIFLAKYGMKPRIPHTTGLEASLRIKPTDALNSNFIGIIPLHVSSSLSAHHQEFLAYIGFGIFYAVVTNRLFLPLVANDHHHSPPPPLSTIRVLGIL
jgi:hypothetical protein